jgi:uncharacterized membrane protein
MERKKEDNMNRKISKSRQPSSNERNPSEHDQLGLERLIFFSDAVFAIAITLLALEIRLPAGGETLNDMQLFAQLTGMWHRYLAYFISFSVIGVFWISHQRKFRFIKRYDGRLLILNLLILMMIAFIPFPSSIISENPNRIATVFYALTMTLVGLLLAAMWWYASWHNRLVDPALDRKQRSREFVVPLITATIFLLSIAIALLNADVAKFSWLLTMPATIYANKN